MTQPASAALPPNFCFTIDGSLAEWAVPSQAWLGANREKLDERQLKLDRLATGSIVFNPDGKVLLLQRAPHDSMPNRWEIPGGGADDNDSSILHSAARELWEESGLVATCYNRLVTEGPGGRDLQVFPNSTNTLWLCRFSFDVDVQSTTHVKLDPAEHQDFLWASEAEIRASKVGDRDITITNNAMLSVILEAFRLRNEQS